MRSSIRNNRDRRSVGTYREARYNTDSPSTVQKTTDGQFTEHGPPPGDVAGQYRRVIDTPSKTDMKIDAVHELIRDQLAPRVRQMSANAVLSDRWDFYYFSRKRTGRRCSCFSTETSPDNQCPICLGVGVVTGYEKFGTLTEILDYTLPNLVMVNCEPNLADNTRPVYLKLSPGYRQGYVEGVLPIRANIGRVDTTFLSQPIFNLGVRVHAFDPDGHDAYITKSADLTPFLRYNQVRIRLEFNNVDERPLVSHFMMRYQTFPHLLVPGDVSRIDNSFIGSEVGSMEIFQELPIFFDSKTLITIQNEDLIYRLKDGKRFKLVNVSENRFGGILTSTDCRARYLIPDVDHGPLNLLI